jgi:hypothetical protein
MSRHIDGFFKRIALSVFGNSRGSKNDSLNIFVAYGMSYRF